MSTKLPALVPFNDPVTVCVSCRKAACALQRFRCAAAKSGPVGLDQLPLTTVQATAGENCSYWKARPVDWDDDMPLDVADMEHLVRWTRERGQTERAMLHGYLAHELGIDPDQVAEAMAKEWPDAGGAS